MTEAKRVRCLYVKPDGANKEVLSLDLQETLCRTYARTQGWHICKESYASLLLDNESMSNIFKQLIDISCRAAASEFDVLLVASRLCLDIPKEYVTQVTDWLRENNVDTWSVGEGNLSEQ